MRFYSLNKSIGSFTYGAFFLLIICTLYNVFGLKIFDKNVFALVGIFDYLLVRFFLRLVGIWKY